MDFLDEGVYNQFIFGGNVRTRTIGVFWDRFCWICNECLQNTGRAEIFKTKASGMDQEGLCLGLLRTDPNVKKGA